MPARSLKGQGHVTVNKPVNSIIYILVHTWPLCSTQILVDGLNPQGSYFQKSTNISAVIQHMSVSFVFLRSSRAHLQNSTFILKKNRRMSLLYGRSKVLPNRHFKRSLFTLRDPAPLIMWNNIYAFRKYLIEAAVAVIFQSTSLGLLLLENQFQSFSELSICKL